MHVSSTNRYTQRETHTQILVKMQTKRSQANRCARSLHCSRVFNHEEMRHVFYERIRVDTHLCFARLKSSEHQHSPEAPECHYLEGHLLKKHIKKNRIVKK